MGKTLRLFAQADFGGIGDDAHRTAATTALLEWTPAKHVSIGGGYGVMYLRSEGKIVTKPVHFSQTLHGPMLTLGIPF